MKIAIVGTLLEERHNTTVQTVVRTAEKYGPATIVALEKLADQYDRTDLTSFDMILVGETPETLADDLQAANKLTHLGALASLTLVRDVDDNREPITDGPIIYVDGEDFESLIMEVEGVAADKMERDDSSDTTRTPLNPS